MINWFVRLALAAVAIATLTGNASPVWALETPTERLSDTLPPDQLLAAVMPRAAIPRDGSPMLSDIIQVQTKTNTTSCIQYGGYPFRQGGCINGPDLNKALQGNYSPLPPQNNVTEGAGKGAFWTDLSTGNNTPTLRQCIAASGTCRTSYLASDWLTWGQYNFPLSTFTFGPSINVSVTIGTVTQPLRYSSGILSLQYDATLSVNGSGQLTQGVLPSGHLFANTSGIAAAATDSTVTALLDRAFGSTPGNFLQRGASVWAAGPIVTSGTPNGVMFLNGSSVITSTAASPYRDLITSLTNIPQLQFRSANVKSGGAVCNGSGDDLAAIQATVDYVFSTFGGGLVFFPPGNCKVSNKVIVRKGVILQGSGATVTGGGTQITAINDTTVLDFPDSVAGGDWSGFKDIWVLGKQSLPSTSSAVVVGANALVHMQDCQVWGSQTALFDKGTDGIRLNCAFMGLTNNLQTQGANWYIRDKFDEAYATVQTAAYIGDSISGFPQENHFIQSDFSGAHLTHSLIINDATQTALTAFSQSVFSSPITLSNGYWAGFDHNEFGSATFFINGNHPFVTLTGNRALLPVTVTGFLNGLSAAANSNITPEFNFTTPLGPINFGSSATYMSGLIFTPGSNYVCADDVTGQLTRFTDCHAPGGGQPVLHVGSTVSDSFDFSGAANSFSGGVTFTTANLYMTALTATAGSAYVCVGPGAAFQLSKSTTFCGSNPGYVNAVNPTNGIAASITGNVLNVSWGGGTVSGTTDFTGAITLSNNIFVTGAASTPADAYMCVASGSSFQVAFSNHCGSLSIVTHTGGTIPDPYIFSGSITFSSNVLMTALPHTAADAYVCVASGSSFQIAYNASCGPSDVKLKNLLRVVSERLAGALIDGVTPWVYSKKNDPTGLEHFSLIAQEVAVIDKTCVTYDDQGQITSTDDRCLIAVLWTEVRRLRREGLPARN